MKKILNCTLFILSQISIIVIILMSIITLLGYRTCVLKSGSMEPAYPKGSIVLINTNIKYDDLHIGDVIVYQTDSGSLVMHRYLGHNTLKGDRNQTTENVELSTQLIGRESLTISLPSRLTDNLGKLRHPDTH